MPIAKLLRHPRSQSPLPAATATIQRPSFTQPLDRQQVLPGSLQQHAPWRALAANVTRTMAEIVTRFTIYAGIAFPNLLLAILSWAIAEFLAGCAAYGQALYCTPMTIDDHLQLRDPEPAPAFSKDQTRVRATKPFLVLVSERTPGLDWHVASEADSVQPAQGAQVQLVEFTRSAQTIEAPARWWSRAIVAPMIAVLSKIREVQARHQAVMELNAFDDRSLRDIGLCRSNIEAVVGCEGVERCDRGPQR